MVDANYNYQSVQRQQDTGTYSTAQHNYDAIKAAFENNVQPGTATNAQVAWGNLANLMGEESAPRIIALANDLLGSWESEASVDAQKHLQFAEATARALADNAMQMARGFDYAAQYASWYRDHVPGTGMVQTSGDDGPALEHMVRFLSRLNEVIGYTVPPFVQT